MQLKKPLQCFINFNEKLLLLKNAKNVKHAYYNFHIFFNDNYLTKGQKKVLNLRLFFFFLSDFNQIFGY